MSREKNKPQLFMIVDGNSLMHRGFHAIPHLSTSKGEPVNAVYGFALILLKALAELRPDYVAVAFDLPGPTFRDKLFAEYKATRVRAPSELYQQIPHVKEFVRTLGIPIFEQEGYEADDILGTLAAKTRNAADTIIVTGDLDTLQLIDAHTKVYTTRKGMTDTVVYDEAKVRERYGLSPSQFVDFKALKGDPSDNIPGVKGIGEKTAAELIKQFGTLDALYFSLDVTETIEGMSPRVLSVLRAGKEQAFLSRKLAAIAREVPLNFRLEDCTFGTFDTKQVTELLQTLEFRSLLSRIPASKFQIPNSKFQDESGDRKGRLVQKAPDQILELLQKQKAFAFAVAENSDEVAIAWNASESATLKLQNPKLKELLEDERIAKYGFDLKTGLHIMQGRGVELRGIAFDVLIASYLLRPGTAPRDLATLAFNVLGRELLHEEQDSARAIFELVSVLTERLGAENLDNIFREIEMPLIPVLAVMEINGIAVDMSKVASLEKTLRARVRTLEKQIYTFAGEEFNINSPRSLKRILFEKLGLRHAGIRRGKTGLSTAASELLKLAGSHPIVEAILHFRELTKLESTYVEALRNHMDPRTGRLHTTFHQTVTATGRLSSSDPNMQNIPIRSSLGQEIRACFVAPRGKTLLSLDYSQMELRIVAHIAGDAKMQEIFLSGEDIHTATAAEVFGVKPADVTADMRRQAKAINFGILYGLSARGLSESANMSYEQAQAYIDRYFHIFSGAHRYVQRTVEEVRTHGFVSNPLGRKRWLPEINDSRVNIRAAAERAAINMPVQSMQADVIKIAMINLRRAFDLASEDLKLLLQVHDELLFEVHEAGVHELLVRLRQIMEEAVTLSVPIVVEAKAGKNWRDLTVIPKT